MSVMIQLNTASCRPLVRQLGIEAMRESRMRPKSHVRFGERDRETHSARTEQVRPVPTLRNLDVAFKRFFQGVAKYPQRKKRSQGIGSFRLTGTIKVGKSWIQLPVLGRVRLKERSYLPRGAHVLSATVSERAGHWFVSVLVEEPFTAPARPQGEPLGIDLGVKDMAVASDGRRFPNPHALKKRLIALKRVQRHLARQTKGSVARAKTKRKLARLHYRVACVRQDALHKATSALVAKTKRPHERPQTVVCEDLNVQGMLRNHKLARAIADVGFGEFRHQLEYKTVLLGEQLLVADPFFPSTQTCSACHRRRTPDLDLAERTFVCSFDECRLVLDRDFNAALNLKALATASSAESHACGQNVSP